MTANRALPASPDLETQVLGAMFVSTHARDLVCDRLTPTQLYIPAHQVVFAAVQRLYETDQPTDPATVADALATSGQLDQVGGPAFLITLQANSATRDLASVERWVTVIEEKAKLRRFASAGGEILETALSNPDVNTVAQHADALIESVTAVTAGQSVEIAVALQTHLEEYALRSRGELPVGYSTGIAALDGIIGGLVPGRLYLIAARPGIGKSALLSRFVLSLGYDQKLPVLHASLEMGHIEVTTRLLACHAKIDHDRLTRGELTDDEQDRHDDAFIDLETTSIEILDEADLNIAQIRSAARRLRSAHGKFGAVVVDYVQLMASSDGRHESREKEVSAMSRSLKLLARKLDCPVAAASQLSRKVEERHDKRPVLSDLRESGALEQDSDVVIFIYRDEYYNPMTADRGIAELIVAKNRQGRVGKIECAWAGPAMAFFDLPESMRAERARANDTTVVASTNEPDEF